MFRSPRHYRSFLTLLLTYTLDLVGFSIAFPVLAPLLLDPHLHFFSAEASETVRTTVLGLLFAAFGIASFFGAPVSGALSDHYGRRNTFLATIGFSTFGYAVMALGVYTQSLSWLFVGRILTGFCSGNATLAQSATADLTEVHHRSRAFGILNGVGGLGFVAGPWIGGKLANPLWLSGSGAFLFAMLAAFLNFWVVFFFFQETWQKNQERTGHSLLSTFKDLHHVFSYRVLRSLLTTYLLLSIGWSFYLIFFPTFLVQKFHIGPDKIGDIFAYEAIVWFFVSIFLNKELTGFFSLRMLSLVGMCAGAIGVALSLLPDTLWPYWLIIPIALSGGALAWINLGTLLSVHTSEHMQGRTMGASGSMWSIGQISSALIAGPLAGWNLYLPLAAGALFILFAFGHFLAHRK